MFLQLYATILDAVLVKPRPFRFILRVPSQAGYDIDLFFFWLHLFISLWNPNFRFLSTLMNLRGFFNGWRHGHILILIQCGWAVWGKTKSLRLQSCNTLSGWRLKMVLRKCYLGLGRLHQLLGGGRLVGTLAVHEEVWHVQGWPRAKGVLEPLLLHDDIFEILTCHLLQLGQALLGRAMWYTWRDRGQNLSAWGIEISNVGIRFSSCR